MTRLSMPIRLALFVYVVAWFLPVIKDGQTLADGVLPGWQAFAVALDVHGESNSSDPSARLISRVSALTNGVMVLGVIVLVGARARSAPAWLPWAFAAATLINTWWAWSDNRSDLRIGYWTWLASFALMAAAVFAARRQRT